MHNPLFSIFPCLSLDAEDLEDCEASGIKEALDSKSLSPWTTVWGETSTHPYHPALEDDRENRWCSLFAKILSQSFLIIVR